MEKNEVILQIGGEGGDLIIYGVRTPTGWKFFREVVDQSSLMLDESAIEHRSDVVDNWEGALGLLDRYQWHRLFPLQVHPEFKERVLQEVEARYQARNRPDRGNYGMERWMRLCSSDPAE